ncbi:MAG TPA: 50S ribosomal protein L18Ae [Candidatus Thermoplasmatota archaeon]|nr:50S ribosomal protein L18Ae [Candidatus Thermoplasmatota archaeon]
MTTTPAKPAKTTAAKATKAFQVEGDFQMGRVRQHFVVQVVAADESAAKDRVYATLGSRHGVNRRQVTIGQAKAISGEAVTDAIVRHELGLAHSQ